MVTKYRPLLCVDFVGETESGSAEELVVIERPLVDVMANLPPAFYRPKFGAT
jgi:U3 small nucleolar RNA-associated protein 4